ncbi:MAG: hypothetical protein AABZ63_00985, partial [Actinomycetota bacterium]
GALLSWHRASGWDAVYASMKLGVLIETRPIIGWATVTVPEPGRKNQVTEVHGIRSIIGSEFLIAGWERSFLGYERIGTDARVSFAKAARAYRRKIRGRKG